MVKWRFTVAGVPSDRWGLLSFILIQICYSPVPRRNQMITNVESTDSRESKGMGGKQYVQSRAAESRAICHYSSLPRLALYSATLPALQKKSHQWLFLPGTVAILPSKITLGLSLCVLCHSCHTHNYTGACDAFKVQHNLLEIWGAEWTGQPLDFSSSC